MAYEGRSETRDIVKRRLVLLRWPVTMAREAEPGCCSHESNGICMMLMCSSKSNYR